MAAGIKVFNPDGSLQFDAGSRIFRTLAINDVTAAGSVTIAGATSQGTIVAAAVPVDDDDAVATPIVNVSGNTVSWTAGTRSTINIMAY